MVNCCIENKLNWLSRDQWEDKWNELKRNCPKMDMDGIGQIFDLTERRTNHEY